MQLSIEPKSVARRPIRSRLGVEAKSFTPPVRTKRQTLPLYALALVVRLGVLGTVLFHAFTFWSW
jgi:hypothetical protein